MNPWSLLKSRAFLPQFLTQFLGACNDNIFKNALIMLIVYRWADLTHTNATILVALASGLFILPFFLFSITAGQIADKYHKSKLIVYMKFAEVLLMLSATIGIYQQDITTLMVTLFLLGVQAAFFGPLKYAVLPELLSNKDLLKGNALTGAGTFIAILLGTIIGTLLIMHLYGKSLISITLIILALLGWWCARYIPLTSYTNPNQSISRHIFREMWFLWNFSRVRPTLFFSILGISWFWFYGASLLAIFPTLTKSLLFGNETVVTFFMAIFSIGIAIGSLIYGHIPTKIRPHTVYLSLFTTSFFTADLGWSVSTLPPALHTLMSFGQFLSDPLHFRIIIDTFGMSILAGIYTVPLYTFLQKKTPKPQRARIIAFNNIMNALFMVISALSLMLLSGIGCTLVHNLYFLALGNGLMAIYCARYKAVFAM